MRSFGIHTVTDEAWARFADRLTYVPQSAGPEGLTAAVKAAETALGPDVRRLHYLSVPPKAAESVITMLRDADLADNARVVMEKPFGDDLPSAMRLNNFVHSVFDESQIFRIDHFLGKEAAQNILAFRFANGLFEPIWSRNFIDHIQIDIPETLGLDQRANFYESTGAYKDMVVTHLHAGARVRRDGAADRAGAAGDQRGEEQGLPLDAADPARPTSSAVSTSGTATRSASRHDSETETFIALQVGLDNWRWAGVPFYLRTGKRMAEGMRIISIAFKEAPRYDVPGRLRRRARRARTT